MEESKPMKRKAPESSQFSPIDWDDIQEFDGPAHELDYDMVWNDGIQDQAGDEYVHAAVADGDLHAAAADAVQGEGFSHGSSGNKRRFYTDELKIAVYLELLAKTDPPILRRGVTKAVSEKFDVPLRVVQSIWKNGQAGGINQFVNKWSRNCGRK
ncbi:uncharacterized protein C2845_PM11G25980 [Panicum miliaceum]|uniref:DUF7769 domain-containing protein n=1 Tax=Panicum miliaceum TaxID=4540 RepID=A0A3L6RV31_PANMI|nr:uncharacterized protein C2845_PM11G25980 [Panicum miliaceum]